MPISRRCVVVLCGVLSWSVPLGPSWAQVPTTAPGPGIRASMAARLRHPMAAAELTSSPPVLPSSSARHHRSLWRKLVGGVLGTVAGAALGGVIGAHVQKPCYCDDPGLKGLLVGGTLGAVGGGALGVLLASR